MKLMIFFVLLAFNAFAGVEGFMSASRQKLFLEEGMNSGNEVYFVKFSGVKGDWNDKVFKVKRVKRTGDQYVYSFDYTLELSSGKHARTYQLVTDEGSDLVNGTRVRRIKLWTPQFGRDGIVFLYDKGLTDDSQKMKLEEEGKKPFVPEII